MMTKEQQEANGLFQNPGVWRIIADIDGTLDIDIYARISPAQSREFQAVLERATLAAELAQVEREQ